MSIEQKTALISGASQGMGLGVAHRIDISKNNYEKDYMSTLIAQTKERLAEL